MTQTEINDAINAAFGNLAELNGALYNHWISELYDVTKDYGVMIKEKWNEQTLYEMEKDVMMQFN